MENTAKGCKLSEETQISKYYFNFKWKFPILSFLTAKSLVLKANDMILKLAYPENLIGDIVICVKEHQRIT